MRRMSFNGGLRSALMGAMGIVLFLVIWQIIGVLKLAGMGWPPLTDVVATLLNPHRWGTYERAVTSTLRSMVLGYALGFAIGFLFALLGHLMPKLKAGTDQTTAILHATPSIAIAPLLVVFFGLKVTPIAVAALSVFFLIYNATASGLLASREVHRALFSTYGASSGDVFRMLELPNALPSIAAGMKLAVPSALIGTILGEWFGAPQGLGLMMVAAMQNFQIPLLWSTVLLSVMISLVMMGLASFFQALVVRRYG